MLRRIWEFLKWGKTERMLLYVAQKSHSVTVTNDGSNVRITVISKKDEPSTRITVKRREGIYKSLKLIAKFSI